MQYLRDLPVDYVMENAWFTDTPTVVTGYFEFNDISFKKDVYCVVCIPCLL